MTLSGSAPSNRVFTRSEAEVAFAGRVVAPFAETETAGSTRRLQKHLGALLEPRFIGRCYRRQFQTRFHGRGANLGIAPAGSSGASSATDHKLTTGKLFFGARRADQDHPIGSLVLWQLTKIRFANRTTCTDSLSSTPPKAVQSDLR